MMNTSSSFVKEELVTTSTTTNNTPSNNHWSSSDDSSSFPAVAAAFVHQRCLHTTISNNHDKKKCHGSSSTAAGAGAGSDGATITDDSSPTEKTNSNAGASAIVMVPHENDVLLGRGGNNNKHCGNHQLRELARDLAAQYTRSSKKEKSQLSRLLVKKIRQMNPSGRFLKQHRLTKVWTDVGDKVAREKASQVLRDAILFWDQQQQQQKKIEKTTSSIMNSNKATRKSPNIMNSRPADRGCVSKKYITMVVPSCQEEERKQSANNKAAARRSKKEVSSSTYDSWNKSFHSDSPSFQLSSTSSRFVAANSRSILLNKPSWSSKNTPDNGPTTTTSPEFTSAAGKDPSFLSGRYSSYVKDHHHDSSLCIHDLSPHYEGVLPWTLLSTSNDKNTCSSSKNVPGVIGSSISGTRRSTTGSTGVGFPGDVNNRKYCYIPNPRIVTPSHQLAHQQQRSSNNIFVPSSFITHQKQQYNPYASGHHSSRHKGQDDCKYLNNRNDDDDVITLDQTPTMGGDKDLYPLHFDSPSFDHCWDTMSLFDM